MSSSKALDEIKISEPYFQLLGDKKIKTKLRLILIKEAPLEFFSVLTQAVRHLLNGSFCNQDPNFCTKYENSLYLLALPSTTKKDKQKILGLEPPELTFELFSSLKEALAK